MAESRYNSFDALRLIGAALVLVSHSYALCARHEPGFGAVSFGQLGVLMFFGISGFLITQSWLRQPQAVAFLVKRALRILPGLIVVVLLAALALGPLVTTTGIGEYFHASLTRHYIASNILMQPSYELPGVFADNPYPDVVNGSLWTLVHEVHAYVIVAVLGVAGILRRRVLATVALIVVAAAAHRYSGGVRGIGDPRLIQSFAVGALLLLWRERMPWNPAVAAGLVAVAALAIVAGVAEVWVAAAVVPYLVVFTANRLPRMGRAITRHGDFSYGLYLWAFPVQQLIAHLWHDVPPAAMIVMSAAGAAAFAIASWRLVERPAMRLKGAIVRPAPPMAVSSAQA